MNLGIQSPPKAEPVEDCPQPQIVSIIADDRQQSFKMGKGNNKSL